MTDIAFSKNNIPIRLNDERWYHITTGHPEMADSYYDILETIEDPFIIYKGNFDEKIAVSNILSYIEKFIVVVYKEINTDDGFVITAYFSDRIQKFDKKEILWKKH
ncbi:MAG: hypothetical protein ABI288_07440 [Ginsengibacter sp.]